MAIHPLLLEFGDWLTTIGDDIPELPGVYVILIRIGDSIFYETLYIGSTSNLRRRLSNHEIIKRHKYGKGVTGFRVHFREASNFRELEIAMIKKHEPLANIQHKEIIYG